MGWTFIETPRDLNKFVADEMAPNEVLEMAVVGDVIYAAVKVPDHVIAVVILIDKTGPAHYPFGFKLMDETCGPYQFDCPESILDKLTPPVTNWARKWRNKCRALAA